MQNFEFHNTKSLVVERGGAARLGDRMAQMGHKNILFVTDPGLMSAGLADAALQNLAANNLKVTVFSKVEADPPESVILEAKQLAVELQADCVIGFGGGSSMDVAKLVALSDSAWLLTVPVRSTTPWSVRTLMSRPLTNLSSANTALTFVVIVASSTY